MSWTKKITHPNEMVKKGDKVECVVLAVDKEKRRISLSMKHLTEDPWDSIETTYPVDAEVKGKIVRMLDRAKASSRFPSSPLNTSRFRPMHSRLATKFRLS